MFSIWIGVEEKLLSHMFTTIFLFLSWVSFQIQSIRVLLHPTSLPVLLRSLCCGDRFPYTLNPGRGLLWALPSGRHPWSIATEAAGPLMTHVLGMGWGRRCPLLSWEQAPGQCSTTRVTLNKNLCSLETHALKLPQFLFWPETDQ